MQAMDATVLPFSERARKNEQALLRAVASVGQKTIAEALGVSEATVSRMKDGEFERFSRLAARCGLKLVPVEMKCYRPESIAAILTLAQERMDEIKTPDQLVWDED